MNWALESCFENHALWSRKTLYCLECGHSWKDGAVLVSTIVGCTCPNCGKDLKLTAKRKDSAYFAIITQKEGVQIVRMFWAQKDYAKQTAAYSWISEVMQHFIFSDGKVVTLEKQVNGLSRYFDQWVFNSDLQVRTSISYHSKLRYDLGPYKIYPERSVIQELKRNGFTGHFYDFTPHKLFSLLLSVPAAETLLKSRQIDMLRHLSHHPDMVSECWPSIKICLRNGYIIKDVSLWIDYIDILKYFGKDVRNSHYVCPSDLRSAHDKYVKKRKAIDRAKRLEDMRKEIDDAQVVYEQQKKPFFGLQLSHDDINIKVLEHVREFMEEGDELEHCVFNAEYHKRPDSLIMSASINEKRVETVEVSLNKFDIVQCRGLRNKSSTHHKEIIELVKVNMNKIRELAMQ